MNQRQFASVLFAALGVFLAVSELPNLLVLVSEVARSSGLGLETATASSQLLLAIMALVGSVVVTLIGVGLVTGRDRLAARLFPQPSQPLAVPEAQVVLGVLLFFGARGLAGLWGRLRAATAYAPPGDAPAN